VRPFAGDRFAVVLLPLMFAVVGVVAAFVLRARRDLGAGMLAERTGPAHGGMGNTWQLGWRLNRGALLFWAIAIVLFGVLLGSLTSSVSDMVDSPALRDFFQSLGGEQGIVNAFLSAELAVIGSIVAAFGILAAGHLRSEEASGHAEIVLATDTTRMRWAAGMFGHALGGVAVLLFLAGAAVGVGHALDVGGTAMFDDLVLAGLARIPAAWVLTALVLTVFGWAPQLTSLVWGVYAAFIVLVQLGALWNLPQWMVDLSPFAHSPTLPVTRDELLPVIVLTMVAAVLTLVGYLGWRRRALTS